LELIADYAQSEKLPLMMHAAESAAEDLLLREGCGYFADGLAKRNIEWVAPRVSTIQYLKQRGILETQALLAHCVRVDEQDIEMLAESKTTVAHCPKSNAKLGHGRAPFARFLERGLDVGLGSDSVASNNTCDILEEARFAALIARGDAMVSANEVLATATTGPLCVCEQLIAIWSRERPYFFSSCEQMDCDSGRSMPTHSSGSRP
jgi:5-methylthioadenosine/S-adenosylhomocysteine deaminase